MTPVPEHDFDRLAVDWQALDAPGPAQDAIHQHVRSRTRALRIWAAGELAVGAGALGLMIRLAIATASPIDRIAMLSLAVVVALSAAVSWLNWRGVLHATARSTVEFVDLSLLRLKRMRKAYMAGWALLVVEVAVFGVWIPSRSDPGDMRAGFFAWGLLGALTALAVVFLFAFRRWIARDERRLTELRKGIQL